MGRVKNRADRTRRRSLLGRWCVGCDGPLRTGLIPAGVGSELGLCVDCARLLRCEPVMGWIEPPAGLHALAVMWPYQWPLSGAIVAGKNLGRRKVLVGLGRVLGEWSVGHLEGLPGEAVVTWVPANRAARRRRGFDQGQVLAGEVASRLGHDRRRLLVRRSAPSRAGADRQERLRGPDLRAPCRPPSTVILVDDVCTTGASLRAAAAALRLAGAQRIIGLVVAQAEPGNARRLTTNRRQ